MGGCKKGPIRIAGRGGRKGIATMEEKKEKGAKRHLIQKQT